MPTYTFTPPTTDGYRHQGTGRALDHFWRRVEPVERGQFVWKDSSGEWHTGTASRADVVDAEVMYLPAHIYTLTAEEATELTDAGYTVVET